jgi:dolichyl-phosphooligosaccharide-protein glycotransferase
VNEDKKEEKKDFGGMEVVKESDKEDKDIDINVGKVFSFLKSEKPKEEKSESVKVEEKGSDKSEEDIDLSKLGSSIKGMFKRGKKAVEENSSEVKSSGTGSDEDVSINIGSITDFFNKRGALVLLIIGIVISMGMIGHVRLQSAELPFTQDWAANTIASTIQNDITTALNEQYPNLPTERKQQILGQELAKVSESETYLFKTGQYAGQTVNIEQQIEQTSSSIKEFYKDDAGRAYSPDIDPYYWHRYAENLIETGMIGDEIKNGQQWDNRQIAPQGRPIVKQDVFFPNFIAGLYKVVKVVNPSVTLWRVQTTYYPVLITSLTGLFIFLIGLRIAGKTGGFFAALIAGLHSSYVSRTIHGDNDATVIFFAMLTLLLFIYALYQRKVLWRVGFSVAAGLSAGFFSLAWGGWWFIFFFILAAAATAISAGILAKVIGYMFESSNGNFNGVVRTVRSSLFGKVGKRFMIPTAIFFGTTGLVVSLLFGPKSFVTTPFLSLGITKLKTAVLQNSFWPNVLTTVAELNEGNFSSAVQQINPGVFWLALLSSVLLIIIAFIHFVLPSFGDMAKKIKIKPKEETAIFAVFFAAIVLIWFAGTIFAFGKGVRFILLLAPMAGLGLGITLGLTFKFAVWANDNFLKINRIVIMVVIFTLMLFVVNSMDLRQQAYAIANNNVPIMNDAWYNSLITIKEDSNNVTKDAIITSWWDFGHHFKDITDRRVTFDGTTQQGPQAHWVGKFFMMQDERHAAGILRMLDCGSQRGFDNVNIVRNNFAESIKVIDNLTAIQSRDAANKYLVDNFDFTTDQALNVTKETHCDPPEGYVIASEDMIGKSGVWGHFGSWNFERGIAWQSMRGLNRFEAVERMKELFGYTDEQAEELYGELIRVGGEGDANTWISPWPSFSGNVDGCGVANNGTLVQCSNGLQVNLTTNEPFFPTNEGVLRPVSFVYLESSEDGDEIVEKFYTNDTVPQRLSVALVPQGSGYYSVTASPEQIGGMFTKMFFFEGRGLKHFDLLTHNTGLTGTNVYVYKADWDSLE